jgi:hypothetical protein
MTDTVSAALIGATGAAVAALLAGAAQVIVAYINNRRPKSDEPAPETPPSSQNQKDGDRRQGVGLTVLLGVIAALFAAVGIFGLLKVTDEVKNGVLVAAATIVVALIFARKEPKGMKRSKVLLLVIPVGGALLGIGIARARQALEPSALTAPVCIANNYYPSGFMGDGEGENPKGTEPIDLNDQWTDHCHSDPTCVKVVYHPPSNKWAGVYWQYPDGNWGDEPGRKIIGAKKLVFWARGEKGGELVSFKVGGNDRKKYKDSLNKSLGPLKLTTEWKQYEIDLSGADTSSVIGAFAWTASARGNPDGLTFYLEGICFTK